MNFQSGLARKGLLVVICVWGAGCEPAATHVPLPATRSPISPTLLPDLPSVMTTLTHTPPTTSTATSTVDPYGNIPEQTNDDWQTTSLVEAGINPVPINKMLDSIYRGQELDEPLTLPNGERKLENIDSILIVKDGRLVFEEYFNGYARFFHHDVASVNKSITSLLVGIAIEQGYLGSVDDQVLPHFPNYLPLDDPDARKEEIAIEDLLTMRNGLDCDDWDPDSRSYYQKQQPNRVDEIEYILNLPMRTNPGFHYSYCTWGVAVLNALLMDATGRRLSEFAEQNLLQPLGIDDARWHDAVGKWDEIDGVSVMLPRDMARVGQLMLQNGNWNGTQIVPLAWVARSTRRHTSIPGNSTWGKDYGYLWWLSEVKISGTQVHSISASGHGGQVITIFPDLNMVVVITGGNYENDEGQPFEIMERFILPAALPVH